MGSGFPVVLAVVLMFLVLFVGMPAFIIINAWLDGRAARRKARRAARHP
jgi:hypothetical protein